MTSATTFWPNAPWPSGTCLEITQGPTGRSHSPPRCAIDLDDGCFPPGSTEFICGFASCRVHTPCRTHPDWGTNLCLEDVATGEWQFIAHAAWLEDGVTHGAIVSRGARVAAMGNTGTVFATPGCAGAGTHLHLEGGTAGTVVGGVSSCPPWPITVGGLVCSSTPPAASCAQVCGNGKCAGTTLPANGGAFMVPGSPKVYRRVGDYKHHYVDEECFFAFHASMDEIACVDAGTQAGLLTAPALCSPGSFVKTASSPTVWVFTAQGLAPLCGPWSEAAFESRCGHGFEVVVTIPNAVLASLPKAWGVWPPGSSAPTCQDLGCGHHTDPEAICWGTRDCGACSCDGPTSEPCQRCGTRTRTCDNGTWTAFSECADMGACEPGETAPCGDGGTRTCDGACGWGPCTGQTCVGPSVEACQRCGTRNRTCDNGTWTAFSECAGVGACEPNETAPCGDGGIKTCTSACGWGSCVVATASCPPFVVRLPAGTTATQLTWRGGDGAPLTTTPVASTGGTYTSPAGACAATFAWSTGSTAGAPTGTAILTSGQTVDLCQLGVGWGASSDGACLDASSVRFSADRTAVHIERNAFALIDGSPLALVGDVCAVMWALGAPWHNQEIPVHDADQDGWLEFQLPPLAAGATPYSGGGCGNAPPTLPARFSLKRCGYQNWLVGNWLSFGGPWDTRVQAFGWRGIDDTCTMTGSLAISWTPALGYWASGASASLPF